MKVQGELELQGGAANTGHGGADSHAGWEKSSTGAHYSNGAGGGWSYRTNSILLENQCSSQTVVLTDDDTG